jgi:hypothetical protein
VTRAPRNQVDTFAPANSKTTPNIHESIMKRLVGQLLRLGGLLVEMLGVLAVMKGGEGIFATKLQLPGLEPVPLAWIGIALGFVLWLIGTVLVYWSKPSRQAFKQDIEEPLPR